MVFKNCHRVSLSDYTLANLPGDKGIFLAVSRASIQPRETTLCMAVCRLSAQPDTSVCAACVLGRRTATVGASCRCMLRAGAFWRKRWCVRCVTVQRTGELVRMCRLCHGPRHNPVSLSTTSYAGSGYTMGDVYATVLRNKARSATHGRAHCRHGDGHCVSWRSVCALPAERRPAVLLSTHWRHCSFFFPSIRLRASDLEKGEKGEFDTVVERVAPAV